MEKARGWCFTVNNYTVDDEADIVIASSAVDYLIAGYEVGKEGTPHIQGYLYVANKKRFPEVKKMLPRAHIEVSKGTPIQALTYCMKDNDYVEFGTRPQQGRRTDLEAIAHDIIQGVSDYDIYCNYSTKWFMYRRAFDAAKQFRRYDTELWIYDNDDYRVSRCLYAEPDLHECYIVNNLEELEIPAYVYPKIFSRAYKKVYYPLRSYNKWMHAFPEPTGYYEKGVEITNGDLENLN